MVKTRQSDPLDRNFIIGMPATLNPNAPQLSSPLLWRQLHLCILQWLTERLFQIPRMVPQFWL